MNKICINQAKPTFKVGDWVSDKMGKIFILRDADYAGISKKNKAWFKSLKLWQPVKDELCVFWDNTAEEYFIGKYGTQILISTFGTEFNTEYYLYDKDNWDNVAPLEYIQQFITRESRW